MMPIDARARADGNIRLEVLGRTRYAIVGQEGSGLYVSHFAVCPERDQNRPSRTAAAGSQRIRLPGDNHRRPGAAADEGPAQLTLEDLD